MCVSLPSPLHMRALPVVQAIARSTQMHEKVVMVWADFKLGSTCNSTGAGGRKTSAQASAQSEY